MSKRAHIVHAKPAMATKLFRSFLHTYDNNVSGAGIAGVPPARVLPNPSGINLAAIPKTWLGWTRAGEDACGPGTKRFHFAARSLLRSLPLPNQPIH
jgi:hypothetical protein